MFSIHMFSYTFTFHVLISPLIFSTAEMNRHHYSLYVHNCRLILLLRQDPSEAENYKPAEFHWKLDQVSGFYRNFVQV